MSTLLVCSVGGHLAELHALLPRIPGLDDERLWVTFDTPQSRSLLEGEPALFVEHSGPRDVPAILRNMATARSLLCRDHRFTRALSTGSGIALSFLPLALARGVRCHYVESFTRGDGPSLTGRLLSCLPGVRLYSQHRAWAQGRWRYAGSILDEFEAGPQQDTAPELKRVVVTLGTMQDYAFPRLIERLHALLEPDLDVLWQLGCTRAGDLPIDGRDRLSAAALRRAVERADLVIAHAGCGSALAAMEAGKTPLLVPRRAARGENVDDHQVQLGVELAARRLAVVRELEELNLEAMLLAAAGRVLKRGQPPPFRLVD
jgi:UDP-N-acetylglucosamine--N-acetylmuramyl-(pentapeptide) pyrophosphoryl-undecaprenol N-acetylglucosamine transferase